MRSNAIKMIKFLVLCLVLITQPFTITAQSATLRQIVLKDKVLEGVLYEYIKECKVTTIAIIIERYDNDYTYTLYEFGLFDQIKKNPTTVFGSWKNSTLLFYSGLESLITPLDSNAVNIIEHYLRPKLPDQFSKQKVYSNGIIEDDIIVFDPNIWRFKVRENKVLWLRKIKAYQSEQIPYIK